MKNKKFLTSGGALLFAVTAYFLPTLLLASTQDDFVITVKTDNPGTSTSTRYTIPAGIYYNQGNFNYNVDCNNDGINEVTGKNGASLYTCNYAVPGIYTIRIKDNTGQGSGFPYLVARVGGDEQKIIEINQWGTGKWSSMANSFERAVNLTDMGNSASDAPNFSNVTSLAGMFARASLFNYDIGHWDVSTITNMQAMFSAAPSFNQDISAWNTSNVANMNSMFSNASSFDRSVGTWNVEKLTSAADMFRNRTLSEENYDSILEGWAAQNTKENVTFSAGESRYCRSAAARNIPTSTKGWTIFDGGKSSRSECLNSTPTLTPIPPQTTTEGQPLTFTVSATDPDNDALTLSAADLPTGATFTPNTGEFSWTPDFNDEGTYNVTFTATENTPEALATSTTVTVSVINFNRAPELAPIGNQTVNEGAVLQFTVSATDPDNDALTLSAANLPSGATFTPSTGLFTWSTTYTDAGNYENIEFTATDNSTPMELDVELITITVGDVNRLPELVNLGPQSVLEEDTVSLTVLATDPDDDTVTLSAANLPSGASFNPSTGAFTWTPTLADAGTYTVTFIATDNGTPVESASTDVIITVGDNPTPTEQAQDLIENVVIIDIPQNVENSYLANLQKVGQFIQEGKITAALNQLSAFINKITQDYNQNLLTQAEYETLLAAAENLVDDLTN